MILSKILKYKIYRWVEIKTYESSLPKDMEEIQACLYLKVNHSELARNNLIGLLYSLQRKQQHQT